MYGSGSTAVASPRKQPALVSGYTEAILFIKTMLYILVKAMKVRVFSTKTCPWCHTVKEWLKEHNIEFEDIDVGEDQEAAKEMIDKSGQMGIPVTEINGQIIVGFDEEKLKKALKIKE